MATRTQQSERQTLATRAFGEFRDSVLVKLVVLGILFVIVSIALEALIQVGFLVRGLSAVWSVNLLIWGIALILVGGVGRTLIWWRRR